MQHAALKEFQLQKKPSVGPPSRKGLNYTKKALLFSSTKGAVVRDQCEKLSIEVRLKLFPYINLGRNLPLTPTARQTTRAPGCSSFTFSEERRAQKTSWLQAAPSLFFCPDFSASLLSPHPKSSSRLWRREALSPTHHPRLQIFTTRSQSPLCRIRFSLFLLILPDEN